MLLKVFTIVFVLFSIISCGDENIFEGASDSGSSSSVTSGLEVALNEGNYNKIIETLGSRDINTLSPRDTYLLQMGYMGRAGFSATENLDELLDNTDADLGVVFHMQSSFSDPFTRAQDYNEVLNICNRRLNKDDDIKLACGFASTMQIMLGVGSVFSETLQAISPACTPYSIKDCTSSDITSLSDQLKDSNSSAYKIIDSIVQNQDAVNYVKDIVYDILGEDADESFKNTIDDVDKILGELKSPQHGCAISDLVSYIQNQQGCLANVISVKP